MEGEYFGKVVQFPGSAANDNAPENQDGSSERVAELDLAKAATVRRIIGEVREAGAGSSLWSEAALTDMQKAVSGFTLANAIKAVNEATESASRDRATYYHALLNLIDSHVRSVQDDE